MFVFRARLLLKVSMHFLMDFLTSRELVACSRILHLMAEPVHLKGVHSRKRRVALEHPEPAQFSTLVNPDEHFGYGGQLSSPNNNGFDPRGIQTSSQFSVQVWPFRVVKRAARRRIQRPRLVSMSDTYVDRSKCFSIAAVTLAARACAWATSAWSL
jgi:hypothetical protein